MPEKMSAYRIVEPGGRGQWDEVDIPTAGPGEIVIKVDAAGLCRTDLEMMDRGASYSPWIGPFTLGHENAGVITEVGQSVHRLSVGQSVLVTANSSCGLCRTCMSGKDAFCVDRPPNYGYADNGGLAPFMKVRARDAMDCGSLNPIAAAPLADAGSTAYGAILDVRPYVRDDGSVLVIGIGGVGSTVVRLLRALTSVEVIAVDHPDKTEFAAQCGAHHFVPTTESTGEGAGKVMAMTGGRGVDATIDVVGSDQSLAFAGAVTASLGAISIVGLTGGTYQYGWTSQALGVRLFSSCTASLNELQELIRIFERTGMEIETSKYRFQDLEKAYDDLRAGTVVGRAVIDFDQ